MKVWFKTAKIFAFVILIFANYISAQTDSIYQLQTGTILRVEMDNEINSGVAGVNDTFTATLSSPVVNRETMVLPIGTIFEGRVTKVRRAAFGGKSGILEVSFQKMKMADGSKRDIEGVLVKELKAESSTATNALTILGGTAIGGIIGAVAKQGGGALIGAGIGAGAGTGAFYLRKGKELSIKADEEFEIKLTKTVNLPVQDY
jgi:hypothetical protein